MFKQLLFSIVVVHSISLETEVMKMTQRQQYEVCRDKLFTLYPYEVNQTEWRSCMEVGHGKRLKH